MNVLLVTTLGADEIHAWRACLAAAAPAHRWFVDGEPGVAPAEVDVAVVAQPPAGRLARLPNLRLVQSLWAGVDRLLADPTLPTGVPIARLVEPHMTAAMVETALWAVLALHRGFFAYAAQQRAGRWAPLPQRRAGDVEVLVLGRGAMGGAVAAALRERGYAVRAWHRGEPLQPEGAQVVVNLLPLTPDTRALLDARFLARLPRGAGVVNLARGAHLVEADLLAALDDGQVGHAVLDVFHEEPLPPAHPSGATRRSPCCRMRRRSPTCGRGRGGGRQPRGARCGPPAGASRGPRARLLRLAAGAVGRRVEEPAPRRRRPPRAARVPAA